MVVSKFGTTMLGYLDRSLVGMMSNAISVYQNEDWFLCAEDDVGNNMPNLFFKGALDDLRIYDRPLSEAEIRALP